MIPPPEKPRLSPRAHGVLAGRLYDHLVALVARGEACPPTHVLAAALDCNIGSIPGLFTKLKARGLVRVEDRSAAMGGGKVNRFRLVTIVATGQCSALRKPPRPGAVRVDAMTEQLEAAKNAIRRRGPVVYATRGGIRVDRRVLTPTAVIALAEQLSAFAAERPTPFAAHYGRRL